MAFITDPRDTILTEGLCCGIAAVAFNYAKDSYLLAIHVHSDNTYEISGHWVGTKARMTPSMKQALARFKKFVKENHLTLRSGSIRPFWLD